MFTQVPPKESAADACAQQLRRAILSGELAIGQRLPPERTLADRFGVNRVTVRSALAQLAAANLVSVRQGSGYRVLDYRRQGGPDLLGGLAELAADAEAQVALIGDLLDVRRALAGVVLRRLATGVEDVALGRIEAAVDAFERAVEAEEPLERLAERDMDVLLEILAATGSQVLQLCMNPVAGVVTGLVALREVIYADPTSNIRGFRLLLGALRTGKSELIDLMDAELERRDAASVARLRHHLDQTAEP